jgi:Spy/CpxP family protein refolding chaperone
MFLSHRAWRYAYAHACLSACSQKSSDRDADARAASARMFSWSDGPAFGVRRPLRYLTWKLDLSETQVRDLVEVLDRVRTAYAQAKLDRDRSTSELAQVFGHAEYDADRIAKALDARTDASRALNAELAQSLARIFAILDAKQRAEFAYLLRSGGFAL